MAANYLHGVETTEIDDGAVSVSLVKTAVIGLVGTAPIFECAEGYRKVNEPVLILNDRSAAKYFGTARDGYTIPQALDSIFDQVSNASDTGAILVINVFDPEGGERTIDVPADEYTFTAAGTLSLGKENISGVIVKNTALTNTYVSGMDYTVDNATGIVTRLAEGAIPAEATVSVSYAYRRGHIVVRGILLGNRGDRRLGNNNRPRRRRRRHIEQRRIYGLWRPGGDYQRQYELWVDYRWWSPGLADWRWWPWWRCNQIRRSRSCSDRRRSLWQPARWRRHRS